MFIFTLVNRLKSGPGATWATCLSLCSKSLHFASFFDDIYIPPFFPVEKLSQSIGFGYIFSALAVH